MKRKQIAAADATSKEQEDAPLTKRARATEKSPHDSEKSVSTLDEIDVQKFLLQDCQALSKKLVEQAQLQANELRRELEKGKQVLLDALQMEKENIDKDDNITPRAVTITIRCITGPHRGKRFCLDIDVKRHTSCFIGRSTGRKFRPPRGLSVPKDSELSTSHGEIKMETTGKLFFIDLDSTNGTRINDVDLEAHVPYELTLNKPIKVEVGDGEYEFCLEQT
ncbi:hypothetical protein KXD40_003033 [Peronospora effusa]|uniref:FHA domain-containing protein n=1 Tax=Peronospora effusa TaxID=542832 RepID=A0A3M6VA55_9STRA|nr:hypothetical protein DD238_005847 [Peronospora effusa]RQM09499.1 hypothetical protein DD237_006316 [Peronospora effusa]UIZ29239.1 hypothetical protein KXD40_003033 [Peronospora effusa]CAI5701862.1 unnamed protein product [Peronospora effusa]